LVQVGAAASFLVPVSPQLSPGQNYPYTRNSHHRLPGPCQGLRSAAKRPAIGGGQSRWSVPKPVPSCPSLAGGGERRGSGFTTVPFPRFMPKQGSDLDDAPLFGALKTGELCRESAFLARRGRAVLQHFAQIRILELKKWIVLLDLEAFSTSPGRC